MCVTYAYHILMKIEQDFIFIDYFTLRIIVGKDENEQKAIENVTDSFLYMNIFQTNYLLFNP